MPAASRTYWLTTPCRIRRKDQSLLIERVDGSPVHIPITDVRDIVACEPVDINTAVISMLNQYRVNVHFLSHYGDYAGSLLTSESSTSGQTVVAQTRLAGDPLASLDVARAIVLSAAANVRRVIDRKLLTRPMAVLEASVAAASTREELMGAEGTFRRAAWAVLDTRLPDWLRLDGRSRRPPLNAGNAFISYVNGIVYARLLSAVRLTPLHSGVAFLAQHYGTPAALPRARPIRSVQAPLLRTSAAPARRSRPAQAGPLRCRRQPGDAERIWSQACRADRT